MISSLVYFFSHSCRVKFQLRCPQGDRETAGPSVFVSIVFIQLVCLVEALFAIDVPAYQFPTIQQAVRQAVRQKVHSVKAGKSCDECFGFGSVLGAGWLAGTLVGTAHTRRTGTPGYDDIPLVALRSSVMRSLRLQTPCSLFFCSAVYNEPSNSLFFYSFYLLPIYRII